MIIKIHRFLGITLVLFVIVLSITGTLLQHADDFNIRQKYASSSIAKSFYNIQPCEIKSFQLKNKWLSICNSNLYFETKKIADNINLVTAAYVKNGKYHIQYDNHQVVVNKDSEILGIKHVDANTIDSKNKVTLSTNNIPEKHKNIIENKSIGKTITYERIIVDIHSGRLFGAVGVTLVDLVTIGIIILSLTGTITWFRHRKVF